MSRLVYSQDELEAESEYTTSHIECGLKLHGGFDADGNYISPRTRYRWTAIGSWSDQLKMRNVEIVEADTSLLTEPNYPSVEQSIFLLRNGVDQPLWDSLTITGLIEARGKALAEIRPPDFQHIIVENISETALGHMQKGLLTSHGWDEGGKPDSGLGGHDVMWFAARDLIFGKDKHPIPVAPENIGRNKSEREMMQIPVEYEMLISFLMNLLMIEVRAERAFRFYEEVINCSEIFINKRHEALHAVELINRIRQDESVHVAWLKTAISEFRSFTIKTIDGVEVGGRSILDPVWEKMVHWHAVEMHEANRANNLEQVKRKILSAHNGADIINEFNSLAA